MVKKEKKESEDLKEKMVKKEIVDQEVKKDK